MTKSIKLFQDFEKKLPECVDIEATYLGMIISNPKTFHFTINIIKPFHFFKEAHQIIFTVLSNLFQSDEPIEISYIIQKLRDIGKLEQVGGASYIMDLTRNFLYANDTVKYALYIVEKYILREIINICHNAVNKSFDNNDPFDIISVTNSSLTKLVEWTRMLEQKEFSKNIDDVIMNIYNIHNNDNLLKEQWIPFNNEVIDKFALISENNTLLIGGKSGSGKTRLVIALIRELLKYNSDRISIKWYSLEDDANKLVRCFLSPMIGLTDEQMEGKNYKMSELELHTVLSYRNIFSKYDVDIVEQPRSIIDINTEYKAFVSKRPDRFNILIIDNLMLLNDHGNKENQVRIDDTIAREIYNIRNACYVNKIKSYIIVLHHFTDEQLDTTNLKTAYRPREKHFKGSTRIRDASTQIMLLNRFANYPDLIDAYPESKDILMKLGVAEITKNRNGSTGIFRFFADLQYSDFKFIHDYGK